MTEPTGAAPTPLPDPFEPPTAPPVHGDVVDHTGALIEPTTLPPAESVAEAERRAASLPAPTRAPE